MSCIGATWIGNGLAGTIALMRPALRPGGLMLVGEAYWTDEPPAAGFAALGVEPDDFTSLARYLGWGVFVLRGRGSLDG